MGRTAPKDWSELPCFSWALIATPQHSDLIGASLLPELHPIQTTTLIQPRRWVRLNLLGPARHALGYPRRSSCSPILSFVGRKRYMEWFGNYCTVTKHFSSAHLLPCQASDEPPPSCLRLRRTAATRHVLSERPGGMCWTKLSSDERFQA